MNLKRKSQRDVLLIKGGKVALKGAAVAVPTFLAFSLGGPVGVVCALVAGGVLINELKEKKEK
jgi:hypothetical protein